MSKKQIQPIDYTWYTAENPYTPGEDERITADQLNNIIKSTINSLVDNSNEELAYKILINVHPDTLNNPMPGQVYMGTTGGRLWWKDEYGDVVWIRGINDEDGSLILMEQDPAQAGTPPNGTYLLGVKDNIIWLKNQHGMISFLNGKEIQQPVVVDNETTFIFSEMFGSNVWVFVDSGFMDPASYTITNGDTIEFASPLSKGQIITIISSGYPDTQTSGSLITKFKELEDTPDDYLRQARHVVRVKSDESGLEFVPLDMIDTEYIFTYSDAMGAPLTGQITFDHPDITLATSMYVSNENEFGDDISPYLELIPQYGFIKITSPKRGITFKVDPVDSPGAHKTFTILDVVADHVQPPGLVDGDELAFKFAGPAEFSVLTLDDTPDNYQDQQWKHLRVREDEKGVEFVDLKPRVVLSPTQPDGHIFIKGAAGREEFMYETLPDYFKGKQVMISIHFTGLAQEPPSPTPADFSAWSLKFVVVDGMTTNPISQVSSAAARSELGYMYQTTAVMIGEFLDTLNPLELKIDLEVPWDSTNFPVNNDQQMLDNNSRGRSRVSIELI